MYFLNHHGDNNRLNADCHNYVSAISMAVGSSEGRFFIADIHNTGSFVALSRFLRLVGADIARGGLSQHHKTRTLHFAVTPVGQNDQI
jgi:hypothetical protein